MKKQIMRLSLGMCFAFMSVYSYGELKGPFFWEVSKKGEKSGGPFYMLGTLHAGVHIEDLQCSNEISTHLEKASMLLVEHNTSSVLDFFKLMIQRERMEEFSSSAPGFKNLSIESRRFFTENFPPVFFNQLGVELSAGQMETANLLVLMNIYYFICLSSYPFVMDILMPLFEKQLDVQIIKMAKDREIPQISLDEMDLEQILLLSIKHALSSIPVEQLEDLVGNYKKYCTVGELEKRYKHLLLVAQMVNPYIKGVQLNIAEKLRKLSYSEESIIRDKQDYEQNILKARNEVWFPKIKKAHQEHGPVFVAAGAGHFIHAYNLIDMLKKDGFSVKRYNRNCVAE